MKDVDILIKVLKKYKKIFIFNTLFFTSIVTLSVFF
jgi:hypothetical protein